MSEWNLMPFTFQPPSQETIEKMTAKIFAGFSNNSKKYSLCAVISEVDNSFETTSGTVTGTSYLKIDSDSRDYLQSFWENSGVISRFSTTNWQFIFNNEKGKVEKVLSMCI